MQSVLEGCSPGTKLAKLMNLEETITLMGVLLNTLVSFTTKQKEQLLCIKTKLTDVTSQVW